MHGTDEVRPRVQRKSHEDIGLGHVMLKGASIIGSEHRCTAMQVPHQVSFAVTENTVTKDQIMHPPADVDGIDLDVTKVRERRSNRCDGFVQEDHASLKAPSREPTDFYRRKHPTRESALMEKNKAASLNTTRPDFREYLIREVRLD